MPKQILDYQYVDGEISPFYYVIELYKCEVNWDKSVYYFELMPPIKSVEYSKVNETLISCSLTASDLIINKDIENRIGINLMSLKKRLSFDIHDPSIIEQFIIYAPDIEMLISQMPKNFTKTFIVTKRG
ncbi:hypothetical protein MHI57_17915 [Cytobacillus sp. FSL K6-0129]|uniref:hypothetical protein n=1 Tax=Cytobacillus sp. FSL K6-0129 TaxID=2921421 RepID=UPI0030FBB909